MEVPDRDEQDEEAGLLLLLFWERYRSELVGLLPDVPDEFWQRVEQGTEETLTRILIIVFLLSARQHGATGLERELAALQEAMGWSAVQAARIASGLSETNRRELADWIERTGAGEIIPGEDLADRLFGEPRADRVAADTVTTAQTAGGEWAVGAFSELNENDTWSAIGDERTCPVCGALDGQRRSEWSESFPTGPPAHSLCRCILLYSSLEVSQ